MLARQKSLARSPPSVAPVFFCFSAWPKERERERERKGGEERPPHKDPGSQNAKKQKKQKRVELGIGKK